LDRYGSHVPGGVNTLGGIFFSIADAESESAMSTTKFTEAAVEKLKSQISFGFLGGGFGIGGSVKAEHGKKTGSAKESQSQTETTSYTYTVKAIGPPATNPATFNKLLSYNSTWAIIDRGTQEGYIPVWELIRDLGSDFQSSADILEQTWSEVENEKKENCERRKKIEKEKMEREKGKKGKEREMKAARAELEKTKAEHLKRVRIYVYFLSVKYTCIHTYIHTFIECSPMGLFNIQLQNSIQF
jgi:predicted nucleic acid-binding Zn ribbon protein